MEERNEAHSLHTQKVRAGQRTYYFDVKATRKGQLYITITENRKKGDANGEGIVERHKIFVYPEDLNKFSDALNSSINFCKENDTISSEENSNYPKPDSKPSDPSYWQ